MNFLEEFIKKESSAGILLIFVTILALLLKNSMFSEYYSAFLRTPVEIRFAELHIAKPLLLWINDGLWRFSFY
jgi:NhaA family Na+:H+ antiporter